MSIQQCFHSRLRVTVWHCCHCYSRMPLQTAMQCLHTASISNATKQGEKLVANAISHMLQTMVLTEGGFLPPLEQRNKCSVLKLRLPSAQAPFTSLTTWHVRHSSSMADSSNAPQSAPICLTSASAFGAIVYGGMRFAFFVFRFFLYEVVATVGFGEGSRAWVSMLATFNPVCVVLTTS